ncbi:hypothetical protein [Hymenobacter sp. DG01]|uniref:hypothetical protein n=1 Tax=Hymenobacter sp. DG01 TaxID=2584940 RepID=UPI00111DBB47|nr:hypothetical protein [Hymenobacter sp. DG01]
MDSLPYFLLLLKKNALLASIIARGTLVGTDLHAVPHFTHSAQAVDLLDFSLSPDETFEKVGIVELDSGELNISFQTSSANYYEQPSYYFGRLAAERVRPSYLINNQEIRTRSKCLGEFNLRPAPAPPVVVWLRHSTLYGYIIRIQLPTANSAAELIID